MISDYASRSIEQQKTALVKLGSIHDQTVNVGGISASILEYLVSRKGGPSDRSDEIRSLQQDLMQIMQTMHKTHETKADDEEHGPAPIHLSKSNRERAESLFIESLQYDSMVDRESRIATAHESTFGWVFQDDQSQDPQPQTTRWSSFREWLESEDQLYWITGKAGSGKSTLTKFLCSPTAEMLQGASAPKNSKYGISQERSRCYPYLEKWAGASRLLVVSFYFWNSGMELQMSRVGLLRTLLCQIVAQCPEIIPVIAAVEWEAICLFGRHTLTRDLSDLHQLLFRATKILRNDFKIVFFVDGLDEFDGSHQDLISMVKDLIKDNSHVKICVASRPWNIFQTAFGQKANLRLEDLTFDDIKNFVESKFYADTGFENLRRRHPSFANKLMENIVVKASGVFLWVDLVVTSLLAGMRLGDRIEDFQRRLDELPPDLEKLYEKILHSLDPFYLEHAAQYFTLVETAEGPLTILQFSFADEETPLSAIKMRLGSLSRDQMALRIEAANRRLNSRCKGFLETDRGLQNTESSDMRHPSQVTIQYLHRTVRDFIKSPKAQSFLRSSTNRDFDPSIQLCVAYLMDMKTWKGQQVHLPILDREEGKDPKLTQVIQCLKRAACITKMNEGAMIELLEELKSVINRPDYKNLLTRYLDPELAYASPVQILSTGRDLDPTPVDSFLTFAVIHGVVPYVRARAEWGGLIQVPFKPHGLGTIDVEWPLLLDALSIDVPDPAMVECLLDLGADPNFKVSKVESQTPWIVALTKVTLLYTIQNNVGGSAEYSLAEIRWKQTLRLLFSRGADCTKVSETLLSPISRRILQDLKDEEKTSKQNKSGLISWLSAGKLGWN
jgi:hypothetical protein